ncbi:hypothetical protein KBZ21_41830, partial [Streptomyces sp. A73]|nr:hypothetical protein [Streptomyces sp. A73]
AFEFVGPCRFGAIADEGNEWGVPAGQPLGVQHPAAWVQIAAEDAFLARYEWDANPHEGLDLVSRDELVLFFDGSKSDDAT